MKQKKNNISLIDESDADISKQVKEIIDGFEDFKKSIDELTQSLNKLKEEYDKINETGKLN